MWSSDISSSAARVFRPAAAVTAAISLVFTCCNSTAPTDIEVQSDGGVARADLFGTAATNEYLVETEDVLLVYNSRGRLRGSIDISDLPPLPHNDSGTVIRPKADNDDELLITLLADVDGDQKTDIILPHRLDSPAGFRVYSGRGTRILSRDISADDIGFAWAIPAAYKDGTVYLLAYAARFATPHGVVAFNVENDSQSWIFHTPSDPLALRETDRGYLVSLGTPSQGVYPYLGTEPLLSKGYDATVHVCEMGYDGSLLESVAVEEGDRPLRGTFVTSLHSDNPEYVLLQGIRQLVVERWTGRVVEAF